MRLLLPCPAYRCSPGLLLGLAATSTSQHPSAPPCPPGILDLWVGIRRREEGTEHEQGGYLGLGEVVLKWGGNVFWSSPSILPHLFRQLPRFRESRDSLHRRRVPYHKSLMTNNIHSCCLLTPGTSGSCSLSSEEMCRGLVPKVVGPRTQDPKCQLGLFGWGIVHLSCFRSQG